MCFNLHVSGDSEANDVGLFLPCVLLFLLYRHWLKGIRMDLQRPRLAHTVHFYARQQGFSSHCKDKEAVCPGFHCGLMYMQPQRSHLCLSSYLGQWKLSGGLQAAPYSSSSSLDVNDRSQDILARMQAPWYSTEVIKENRGEPTPDNSPGCQFYIPFREGNVPADLFLMSSRHCPVCQVVWNFCAFIFSFLVYFYTSHYL